jgi:Zn-dependent protease/CBS domain-containing protein
MGGSTVRVGRLLGVPIGIHPLWLLVVGLITWALGSTYFPDADPALSQTAAYALGLLGALGLFAGIVLHELAHAVVARRHGIGVEEIDLWLLGGVARLEGEAKEPGDELRFAAAGPAVTAVIAGLLGIIRLTVGDQLPSWALALVDYELYVNLAILGFNLLPAFPLDGGRIARSLLWRHHGDRDRATATAARAGRAFGWGLVGLGALAFFLGSIAGLWFALIGWFLIVASAAEAQASRVAQALGERTAADLMSAPAVSLPATLTVADAIATGFTRHLFGAFPVTDAEGRAIGIVTLSDVRALPGPQRGVTTLGAVAHGDPELLIEPSHSASALVADPAFRRVGRAVVIDSSGRPIGVVSVTDIDRRLRAEGVLPGVGRHRRAA